MARCCCTLVSILLKLKYMYNKLYNKKLLMMTIITIENVGDLLL